jgi:small subunit ribosomal protein S13
MVKKTHVLNGITLNNKDLIINSLKKIKGLGFANSSFWLNFLGIDLNSRVEGISDKKLGLLIYFIKKYILTDDTFVKNRKIKIQNLNVLPTIRSFKFNNGLPVRGQSTRTNGATARKNNSKIK